MAPEQWLGASPTKATDIWALGLILHELLTGRHPFRDVSPEASPASPWDAVTSAQPLDPIEVAHGVSQDVSDLVAACLERTPEKRPAANDVAERLGEALSPTVVPATLASGPFRGLLPFLEQHSALFFGRDSEVAAFLELLRERPLLSLVAPSGAGKSSFIQAGVIPRLREQEPWRVLGMRPGRNPFETLATQLLSGRKALRGIPALVGSPAEGATRSESDESPLKPHTPVRQIADSLKQSPLLLGWLLAHLAELEGCRVLLYVDQLEELFTLVPDETVRHAFVQAMASAADHPEGAVRVVLAFRDDFLYRLAEQEPARRILDRITVLRPLGPSSLADVLKRSVAAVGYRFQNEELVREMVDAVQGERAALPLIQFTGQLLWESRDTEQQQLSRAAYEAVGGVAGALARHADHLFAGMTPRQEQVARQLVLRLVTAEGTRQVVPRSQLLEGLGPKADDVLDRLTQGRLFVVHKGSEAGQSDIELELAHESLIQTWGRLARWLEESQLERVFLAEVGQAAELWEKRGRPQSERRP